MLLTLSDQPGDNCYGKITALETAFTPDGNFYINDFITNLIKDHDVDREHINLWLGGENSKTDAVIPFASDHAIIRNFKDACGEYHTATAFGLADMAITMNRIGLGYWSALMYNHWQNRHHSLFLFSEC